MDHTARPEARSSPSSYSGDKVPSQRASGHLMIGVVTRQNRAAQGSHKGASEGYACTLEGIGRKRH